MDELELLKRTVRRQTLALAICGVGIAALAGAQALAAHPDEITVGDVVITERGISIMSGTERVRLTPRAIVIDSNEKGAVVATPGELVISAPDNASIRMRAWLSSSTAGATIDATVVGGVPGDVLGEFSAGAVDRTAVMKVDSKAGTSHLFIAEPSR